MKALKETLCHTSLDYDSDLRERVLSTEEKSYELPDGSILEIDNAVKFKPAEVMFQPDLIDSSENSLGHMLKDSLDRCDVELVSELLR